MPLRCPRCREALAAETHGDSYFHRCGRCRGVAINNAVLRRFAPPRRLKSLWVDLGAGRPGEPCPSCEAPLTLVTVIGAAGPIEVGACRPCQMLWFDATKLAAFSPQRQEPAPREHALSPRAKEALARGVVHARNETERSNDDDRVAAEVIEFGVRMLLSIL